MTSILNIAKDLEKSLRLSDKIPLLDLLDDRRTITTKENSLLQVIKLAGMDYSGKERKKKGDLYSARKGIFESLGPDFKYSIYYQRRKYSFDDNFKDHGDQYVNEMVEVNAGRFTDAFKTCIYLVVQQPDKAILKRKRGSKNFMREESRIEARRKEVADESSRICSLLKEYRAEILTHEDNGTSELYDFWAYMLNGGTTTFVTPNTTHSLGTILATNDIEFTGRSTRVKFERMRSRFTKLGLSGDIVRDMMAIAKDDTPDGTKETIIFHGNHQRRLAAMVSIKDYPSQTNFHILDNLMALEQEFILCQHVQMLDTETAKRIVRKKRFNAVNSGDDEVGGVANDMSDVVELLNQKKMALVKFAPVICVFADSVRGLDDGVREIEQAMNQSYIQVVRERSHTEAAFWSLFPDYDMVYANPRKVEIASSTLSDFVTFGSKGAGNYACSFGDDPVAFFKTTDGQNYAYTFHPAPEKYEAGHTLVIGGTGSGKSVLVAYLIMNCLKYQGDKDENPFKALIFDSFNGLEVPVRAFGGEYVDFGKSAPLLNPLQLPNDKKGSNKEFLEQWLSILTNPQDEDEKEQISRIIRGNYENLENPDDRNLHNLRLLMGGDNPVTRRLARWMPDEDDGSQSSMSPYGMMFNAEKDILKFDKQIVAFDMAQYLGNKEVLPPLASYIFHGFTQHITNNPAPHLCFVDETIQYLENDIMYGFIRKALLEWRKRNGLFVGVVQDVGLLMNNKNGEDFLQKFQTYIIFKDPTADEAHYRDNLGLTDTEIEWLRSTGVGREVMVKRKGAESIILNVELNHLDKYLHLLRGDKEVLSAYERHSENKDVPWQEALMDEFTKGAN